MCTIQFTPEMGTMKRSANTACYQDSMVRRAECTKDRNRQLRMKWVVVTDKQGNQRLQMRWSVAQSSIPSARRKSGITICPTGMGRACDSTPDPVARITVS